MCETSSDCGGDKVCDLGVCWGDPPAGARFAAVLVPPADRMDLARTEIPEISIASNGDIEGLSFADSVTISGRATLACPREPQLPCDPTIPVAAQITFERLSSFEGGPYYSRAVMSAVNIEESESSFAIRLPRDGAEYRVRIVPVEGEDGGAAPPPMAVLVKATNDQTVQWELGDPDLLKNVRGCLQNAVGNGSAYQGMHVIALGRWAPGDKLERASATALTDAEGCFDLSVPIAMEDDFDIVAKPSSELVLPTLRLIGEHIPDPAPLEIETVHEISPPLVMPSAANPVQFKLPIRGPSSGGQLEPVVGATVHLRTEFAPATGETRDVSLTFEATALSVDSSNMQPGMAEVALYPGSFEQNRSYRVRIVPPAESEYGSTFDLEIEVGTGDGASVLEPVELIRRTAVSGLLTTADGEPLANTPVEVRVAPEMRASLDDLSQTAVLDNLQFPVDTSNDHGEFFLWLDRTLLGVPATYDFELAPPALSAAPRWTFEAIAIGEGQEALSLDTLSVPKASYARGLVLDDNGQPVPGAELRLYQLPDSDYCSKRGLATSECQPQAKLRGIWESDAQGVVSVVLPDP